MKTNQLSSSVHKYEGGVRLEVEAPGYAKHEVSIESRLNDFGERIVVVTAANSKRGRSVCAFVAKDMFDLHRADAELVDGLLTIDFPFSREYKTTTIPIM